MRISSNGCTWEVWRALKKLDLLSAAPPATLTHFSCSPNFPRASIIRYTHTKHEQILKVLVARVFRFKVGLKTLIYAVTAEVLPARAVERGEFQR